SQYGRVCPVRSPEGQNIGLVTYLALYARVNDYGFLETPYKKVVKETRGGKTRMKITDEIIYLQADDEEEYYITANDIDVDNQNYIIDKLVPARYRGEFLDVATEQIQLIDVCPRQIVGVSASLIPFLDHDEPSRALMGSHMECQAVPLLKPDAPIVGSGMETIIPQALGRTMRARHNGQVVYVDGEKVVVKLDKPKQIREADLLGEDNIKINKDEETYLINKFVRTSPYGTCYSQRAAVSVGDRIGKGDLVVDGPSCDNGELALGKNLTIAYCSFEGLGYEDAIVISDRLVKEDLLTSITINEYTAEVADTKLGPEELTADIPNVSEEELAKLGEDGIVVIGSHVRANDILVGKIAPKGETELTAEERLLRAIFGEKAREVRDTSLRLPHGVEGIVIEVQVLDRDEDEELASGISKKITVRVAQMRKIKVGDKLSGRHGNKGIISKIISEADMPYLADGTPVDLIISPLSVLSRMNLGQLLEAHLGLVAQKLGYRVTLPVFEKFDESFLAQEFKKANLDDDSKLTLFDGRTGEQYREKTVVGNAHILKLVHMVEDKIHSRSIGPYSLVTQQPLGGKAQMGGQRFGEMEVWGLEAHQAAHALQEMLTIKSDDVVGRSKAFEAIVKGTQIPQSRIPESFKVLVSELKSLGLAITPEGIIEQEEEKSAEPEEAGEVGLSETENRESEGRKKR
ncbi:MAG: DNA-directed RNA polymerase subunit beta, partial [Candidatus Shapirobacteria bacterium]|nr:DNA-directed RNA polymerase subunit beta [Candidatus Shapirobacteria bacterium]